VRVIECSITLLLNEGVHFNANEDSLTDEEARKEAESSFLDVINVLDNAGDLQEYVQSHITNLDELFHDCSDDDRPCDSCLTKNLPDHMDEP
jgi:hypothetical protein